MPTHRESSPELFDGACGSIKVAVADLMYTPEAVGPVLKYGPLAALTAVTAATIRGEIFTVGGMVDLESLYSFIDTAKDI